MTLAELAEKRYRDGIEQIVDRAEEEHGGQMRINVPSLSEEPIPLRDALNAMAELDIAARNPPPITFSCWGCKSPITIKRDEYKKTVRCPQCGKKQATPQPSSDV